MTDTKKPNRKRKIAKRIWLNEMEERELKRKAKKAGVSQSGLQIQTDSGQIMREIRLVL